MQIVRILGRKWNVTSRHETVEPCSDTVFGSGRSSNRWATVGRVVVDFDYEEERWQ